MLARIYQFGENWHNNIKSSNTHCYIFLCLHSSSLKFSKQYFIVFNVHVLHIFCEILPLSILVFWYYMNGVLFLILISNWRNSCYVKFECSVSIEKSKTIVSLFYFGPHLFQEVSTNGFCSQPFKLNAKSPTMRLKM